MKTAETEWPELRLTTKGNPYLMSQAEQDAALRDPRWVGKLASPSSATNSAFYFSHATREAARVLFNHGLAGGPGAVALRSVRRPGQSLWCAAKTRYGSTAS